MKKKVVDELKFYLKALARLTVLLLLVSGVLALICLKIASMLELSETGVEILIIVVLLIAVGIFVLLRKLVPHIVATAKYMAKNEDAFFKEAWNATRQEEFDEDFYE